MTEVEQRLDVDKCIEELNLTAEQWAELEAYDDLYGLGHSRRNDEREVCHTRLKMWAAGTKADDIDDKMFDYLPKTNDPPTDDLERML